MYYRSITENKNSKNRPFKKENIYEIKQNLFQELTTRCYRPIKYNQNNDYFNNYIRLFNIKNNEEILIPEDNIIYEQNFYENNNDVSNRNKKRLLSNKKYNSKYKNNKNKTNNTLTIINSNSVNNNIYNEENDLMYIISKEPKKSRNKSKEKKPNKNNIRAHLALPLCHYHKFNLKLPKKYTCNFKNCSCCRFKENNYSLYNENTKETSRDYIYPSIERSIKGKSRYNNVLEKFTSKIKKKNLEIEEKKRSKKKKKKKKLIKKIIDDNFNEETNENNNEKKVINLRKENNKNEVKKNSHNNNSLNSSKSGEMSDISFNFQKPNETNLKIPKKKLEELDNSLSKSFSLDMPEEVNIEDEKDLKSYKNLVDEKKRKSKIHFSIAYYKKLNKSYKVYCGEDSKKKSSPGKSKEKKIEFLRYD